MKADDIVAEIRAELARRRWTVASTARDLGHKDNGRKLRRQLRGEQDFTSSELDAIVALLRMKLTIEREDPK